MWTRRESCDQDREEPDRLEEESECLHAAGGEVTGLRLRPAQHEIDAVHRNPEHRRKTPAGKAPTGEEEHRQAQRRADPEPARHIAQFGILFGGAILTETVFNIPGIGRIAFDSIQKSDLPTVQGTVLVGAFAIITFNLIVDIAYAFIDPRVRY